MAISLYIYISFLILKGAVVSREYGLPCVVGLRGATKQFVTGKVHSFGYILYVQKPIFKSNISYRKIHVLNMTLMRYVIDN